MCTEKPFGCANVFTAANVVLPLEHVSISSFINHKRTHCNSRCVHIFLANCNFLQKRTFVRQTQRGGYWWISVCVLRHGSAVVCSLRISKILEDRERSCAMVVNWYFAAVLSSSPTMEQDLRLTSSRPTNTAINDVTVRHIRHIRTVSASCVYTPHTAATAASNVDKCYLNAI